MNLRRVATYICVSAAVAILVGAVWARIVLTRPYRAWSAESVDVVLESGLSARSMFSRLQAAGVLRHPLLLRAWLRLQGGSDALHAGEYRFDEPITPLGLVRRLRAGDVLLYSVTIPEGLTLDEVIDRIGQAGFGTPVLLGTAFSDTSAIRGLDPQATDLEGYLFPETYMFPRDVSPEEIARAMVERFREMVEPDFLAAAKEQGLTLREAVTLASLIEKETSVSDERPMIAGVFHNRLKRGMRLQCDPTVTYALRRSGREVERLSRKDLAFKSPWNTYRVSGLPPGPIASPGWASLQAAVAPIEGNALYFVAAPNGGHRFSDDLASHEKAVAEWRRYLRSSR
jgi:UPF0755 protein